MKENVDGGGTPSTAHIRPEDVVIFVELDDFTSDWQDLRLSDDDLHALQLAIMEKPKGPPVLPGTVLAYPKSEKDDLSNTEKKAIKKLIEEIEQEFAKGYRK